MGRVAVEHERNAQRRLPGTPATGRRFDVHGAAHATVVSGKLAELLQMRDEAGFLRQIGQLPDA